MKKLFAMLLVLCMMCGAVSAGAESVENMMRFLLEGGMGSADIFDENFLPRYEALKAATGTQTIGAFTFDIPAGWTADLSGTRLLWGEAAETYQAQGTEIIAISHATDPAIRIAALITPVTSENNNDKRAMDLINQMSGLRMVSPAEISVHADRGTNQSGQLWGPQIEFVTIGSLAGEPIRRTYSGYIGEYIDEDGSAKKARASAVVWSSESIGMEIVIRQITPQYAENFDHVVDEFMKSFRYEGKAGTYDDSAAAAAQKMVSANDFNTSSIEGAKYMWGKGAYLFDLAWDPEEANMDAYRIVTDDTDLSNIEFNIDFSEMGAMGEALENVNPDDYNLEDYDFGGFDFTGGGLGGFGW